MAEKNRRLNGIGILIMVVYGFVCLMAGELAGYLYGTYHLIWYLIGITLILIIGFHTLYYFISRNKKYSKIIREKKE